ncbi:MAG: bifunctional nuclease family protein [Planctomycetes bacterium]|nr:bifunctional nuclease family protein [Planctomycetota bacterium]
MSFRPCFLSQIVIDESSDQQVIFVTEREGGRRIPITIGPLEAMAIDRAIKGQRFKRPLTHDLLIAVLERLNATCREVRIVDLREGIFYAQIILVTGDGREIILDCRPSDAIAVMVRIPQVPLLIAEEVLAEAGG